jgi:hypothetical protein
MIEREKGLIAPLGAIFQAQQKIVARKIVAQKIVAFLDAKKCCPPRCRHGKLSPALNVARLVPTALC